MSDFFDTFLSYLPTPILLATQKVLAGKPGVDNGIQDLGILLPQAEKEQGATLLSHDLIKSRTGMADLT